MRSEFGSLFPVLINLVCSDRNDQTTAGTTGKQERLESRNNRKAGTTGKQEQPEKAEWLECLLRQYIGATKHAAWIGDADRIRFRFRGFFLVRFASPIQERIFAAPIYWRSYKWEEHICPALPIVNVIAYWVSCSKRKRKWVLYTITACSNGK